MQDKQGQFGPLTFVVVQHRIQQRHQVVIDERQDIVYRQAATTGPAPAGQDGQDGLGQEVPLGVSEWAIEVSPTLLFRFSALTYDVHRIHYDREGYSRG